MTHTPFVYLFQSLWRDEAFSVLMAKHTPLQILKLSAQEFNSPLYYLLLHFWMTLFGTSEVAIRLLSFIPHLLLTIFVYRLSHLFVNRSWSWFATLVVFLNPMLLTYAFEARGYSWFALFATLSILLFYQRRWLPYIVVSVLGVYTHPYMLLVLLVEIVFLIFGNSFKQKELAAYFPRFRVALLTIFLLYAPWIPILFHQWLASRESWIYPVDIQLFLSVLGNLFTSYEGTPGWLWPITAVLSFGLLTLFWLAIKEKKSLAFLFIAWIFLPLSLILGFSLFKPLFVNRYLIFVAVAECFLAVMGLSAIRTFGLRRLSTGGLVLLLMLTNIILPTFRQRLDSRSLFQHLSSQVPREATVFVDVLLYFDALYYFNDPERIKVYHLPGSSIPSYVGRVLVDDARITSVFPKNESYYYVGPNGFVTASLK